MRSLLMALLVVLVAGCASTPDVNRTARISVLSEFQLIQNGQVIEPRNGVISLTRNPFYIRHKGNGLRPSIFASSNLKVTEQYQQLHDPLVTWNGTGSAADPSDLNVIGDQLEVYEGWSPLFDKAWGKTLGKEAHTDYLAFRKQLSAEPLLIASGRNYANFVPQLDGARVYAVSRINGKALPDTRYSKLYLVLFADDFPPGREIKSYQLRWAPLVVEFVDG